MSEIKDALFGAADKKSVEEVIAAQGGGGSGGGVMVVNCTFDAEHQIVAGKTAGEIFEAVESGLVVIFNFTYGQAAAYMYCFSADNMDGYHFCVAVTEGDGYFHIVSFNAATSSDNPTYGNK